MLLEHVGDLHSLDKISSLELEHFLNMILIFSYTWGVGGNLYDSLNHQGRTQFSVTMKSKFDTFYSFIPVQGDLFDYFINFQTIRLQNWQEILP
jgi:hypothetical protein